MTSQQVLSNQKGSVNLTVVEACAACADAGRVAGVSRIAAGGDAGAQKPSGTKVRVCAGVAYHAECFAITTFDCP